MLGAVNNSSVFLQTVMFIVNQSAIQQDTDNTYNFYSMEVGGELNETKCYGIYGCYDRSEPWTTDDRPIAVLPNDIEVIEPRYPMFTRHNPAIPIFMDLDSFDVIVTSGIDPLKPLYIISHGYMEGGNNPWILGMVQELLRYQDCSVIVIDWNAGSGPPYTQAVANTRLLGAMTAHLVGELTRYTGDLKLDHVHCIGHSLGAHLCGYLGYALQKDFSITLGRITGLDPAEPHFAKTEPPVRLDKSAAKYVDVIHTDATMFLKGGLGITERIGHVDFFPNGGNNQPGCGKTIGQYMHDEGGSFFKGMRRYLGCNHVRSHELFTESINGKCTFLTVSCQSFTEFLEGKCFSCGHRGQKCITFGFHSKKHYEKMVKTRLVHPRQNMAQYFITGDRKPFCRAHYKITIKVSDSDESRLHGGEVGQVLVTMHSTSDGMGFKSTTALTEGRYYEPGVIYVEVAGATEVKHLKALEVEWKFNSSFFNPLTWRILTTPRIFLEYVRVDAIEINESITVCPKNKAPLISGRPQLMIPAYC